MRVLVTGSRDWTNDLTIMRKPSQSSCPHGARWCTAEPEAPTRSPQSSRRDSAAIVETHPADWERYGKRAGFIRNSEMVNAGADICLAFIKNNSRGATMCADLAERAGIQTTRFTA